MVQDIAVGVSSMGGSIPMSPVTAVVSHDCLWAVLVIPAVTQLTFLQEMNGKALKSRP